MSRASQAENTILPTIESPVTFQIQSHEGDETASSNRDSYLSGASQVFPDCFFKVVDIHTEGKNVVDKGECTRERQLNGFYQSVRPQQENTIRVILDGRPVGYQLVKSDKILSCVYTGDTDRRPEDPCSLYSTTRMIEVSRLFEQPCLRRMWDSTSNESGWYNANSLAQHKTTCSHASPFLHGVSTFGLKVSVVSFAVVHAGEGKATLICCAPDAHIAAHPETKDNSQTQLGCASANWTWMQSMAASLVDENSLFSLSDGTKARTLQLLVLSILCTVLEQNLSTFDKIRYSTPERVPIEYHFDINKEFPKPHLIQELLRQIFKLRRLEKAITSICDAIDFVLAEIPQSHEIVQPLVSQPSAWQIRLRSLKQDSQFYRREVGRHKAQMVELHELISSLSNEKQANSVNQLTFIAALFLPLSLAAGILSMQTRFVDLGLLLYDFVGAVFILGAVAAFFMFIGRYGKYVFERSIYISHGQIVYQFPYLLRILKLTLFAAWWLALLSSFLVGMLKDVGFGLKILGFEAVGITGLWLLSLKGVRMGRGYYRQRNRDY